MVNVSTLIHFNSSEFYIICLNLFPIHAAPEKRLFKLWQLRSNCTSLPAHRLPQLAFGS